MMVVVMVVDHLGLVAFGTLHGEVNKLNGHNALPTGSLFSFSFLFLCRGEQGKKHEHLPAHYIPIYCAGVSYTPPSNTGLDEQQLKEVGTPSPTTRPITGALLLYMKAGTTLGSGPLGCLECEVVAEGVYCGGLTHEGMSSSGGARSAELTMMVLYVANGSVVEKKSRGSPEGQPFVERLPRLHLLFLPPARDAQHVLHLIRE